MSKKLLRKAIEMISKLAEEEDDEYEDDKDYYEEADEKNKGKADLEVQRVKARQVE